MLNGSTNEILSISLLNISIVNNQLKGHIKFNLRYSETCLNQTLNKPESSIEKH